MLLGELRRWGLAPDVVDSLLPAADEAMAWIEDFGDRDGDGYVEYQRATDRGLANQGWKDSWDAIRFADGRVRAGRSPCARCRATSTAPTWPGPTSPTSWATPRRPPASGPRPSPSRPRSTATFWLEDRGWFAMGLDGDKAPIDALASNIGHCLWTGLVDEDKAAAVAERLLSPEMFSGWGIRTLGSNMAGYNPLGYHVGSV